MSTKISDLTSATSLTGAEEVPIVQTGTTKKTTVEDIKSNDYSSTEQRIGTWTNGKPLYRIVYTSTLGNAPSNGNEAYNTTTWGTNVNYGYIEACWVEGSNNCTSLPYVSSGYRILAILGSSGDFNKLVTINGLTGYNGATVKTVICYTKSTD